MKRMWKLLLLLVFFLSISLFSAQQAVSMTEDERNNISVYEKWRMELSMSRALLSRWISFSMRFQPRGQDLAPSLMPGPYSH